MIILQDIYYWREGADKHKEKLNKALLACEIRGVSISSDI